MRTLFFLLILSVYSLASCPAGEGKKISKISFGGLEITNELVVTRELIHQQGSVFSCDQWEIERVRLLGLDIFAMVELESTLEEDSLSLVYRFNELPAYIPFPSAKKTDQDGWLVGGALASVNFLGQDVRLEAHLRTSLYPHWFRANELLLNVESPWVGTLPIEYMAMAIKTASYNSLKGYDEDSWYGKTDVFYRAGRYWKFLLLGGFFSVETDTLHPFLTRNPVETSFRSGFGILRDTRESKMNPHEGNYGELRLSRSLSRDGRAANFAEFLMDFRLWQELDKRQVLHLSFLSRVRPGTVPFYERFHLGGANSLRAFAADPGRSAENEILATAEWRYDIFAHRNFALGSVSAWWGLQWVVGVDAAWIWDKKDLSKGTQWSSIFAGLNILLPGVERLRLELGARDFRLDFDFSLGMFEKSSTQRWRTR